MPPVFIYLLCKYYFMRATARQCLIMKKDFIDKLQRGSLICPAFFLRRKR